MESQGEKDQGKAEEPPTSVGYQDVHWKLCKDTERSTVPQEVHTSTSWKDVDWDSDRVQAARSVLEKESKMVAPDKKEGYEADAAEFWDKFYKHNKNKFFKERHYLQIEFPELRPAGTVVSRPFSKALSEVNQIDGQDEPKTVLELGCGTGSTVFPLMSINPANKFYACDFAETAIEVLKTNPQYTEERVKAFVWDATQSIPYEHISEGQIDIGLMVFMLSAVSPEKHPIVLSNLYKLIAPGGIVMFRDYGLYDMTQMRFAGKGKKIQENFYVRGDGTRSYFFSLETIEKLFIDAGFTTLVLQYDTRELINRKKKLSMYRVWIKAKFQKPATTTEE